MMLSFGLSCSLLMMVVCTNTFNVDRRISERKQSNQGNSHYIRDKRGGFGAAVKVGRRALKILLKDSEVDPSSSKSVAVFVKHGSTKRAEQDFSAVIPKPSRQGTYTNGMEYKIGEVGDKRVTLTKDGATSKAKIEVQRKREYWGGLKREIKTEILYED